MRGGWPRAGVTLRNQLLRAVFKSVYMVTTMVKPVFRVTFRYPPGGGLVDSFQRLPGTDLSRAQSRFELAESSSKWD